MDHRTVNVVMSAVLFTYMIMQPPFGALSDRIGRRTQMRLFGLLAMVCVVPLMYAIGRVTSPYMAYVLIVLALAIVSLYTSISGVVKAEMFPPEVRALSVGFAYAIANALFGGSAEYVALWFKERGMEPSFYWYVTVLCAIAFVAAIVMPDPKVKGYLHGHESDPD
jgi:MHS family alpha-ketoglutarate permease-like MFS transporter